jgi:hypothetical protein
MNLPTGFSTESQTPQVQLGKFGIEASRLIWDTILLKGIYQIEGLLPIIIEERVVHAMPLTNCNEIGPWG